MLQAGPPTAALSSQLQQQPEQQHRLYRDFLQNLVVQQFKSMSRCLPDLASQAAALWPRYVAAATVQQPQRQRQHVDDDEVRLEDTWATQSRMNRKRSKSKQLLFSGTTRAQYSCPLQCHVVMAIKC
jgi:hypothetical protein